MDMIGCTKLGWVKLKSEIKKRDISRERYKRYNDEGYKDKYLKEI